MKSSIKYKGVVLAAIMSLATLIAYSQKKEIKEDNTTSLKLIARATPDSVVLRWAPTTPGGWIVANTHGYRVERLMLSDGIEISGNKYEALLQEPLKPMELEAWKNYAGPNNRYSAIAAQALYGNMFVPKPLASDSLINLRNAADELTNRYSFALFAADNDPVTANALGLRFVDKNVKVNSRYVYRVYVAAPTTQMVFDTAYIMVETLPTKEIGAPVGFNYRSGDGSVQLIWSNNLNPDFTGYNLYRSDDGGKNFKPINQQPIVYAQAGGQEPTENILYIDTATVNYRVYTYRLVGITPFGELSAPAEIKAFSRDLTPPPAPELKKPVQVAPGKVKISWEYKLQPVDLKGFVVAKSKSANTEFAIVTPKQLDKKVRDYTLDLGDDFEAYVMIAAVDTAGNFGFSAPVLAALSETPVPIAPNEVYGKIDKNGKVTLSWKPVRSKNIIGYRIYMANDLSHKFIAVTGDIHPDTIFIDSISLKTLTPYVYYRVAAVNSRYQHSELSPILKLRRPDSIPPAVAVFHNFSVTDKSVMLQWHCSPSADVAIQRILRKTENEDRWTIIDSLAPGIGSYEDRQVKPKTTYFYSIVSIDSSGNVSKMSSVITARPYDSGKREPVKSLIVEYNKVNRSVLLKWSYDKAPSENYWFVLYRSNNDKGFLELKGLKSDTREFEDASPQKGMNDYGIVVMTTDGGQSDMVIQRINITE